MEKCTSSGGLLSPPPDPLLNGTETFIDVLVSRPPPENYFMHH